MELSRKKRRKYNNGLIYSLIVLMICAIVVVVVNIVRVNQTNTGEGNTIVKEKVNNEYVNSQYTIGHNPTDINKTYFKELTASLDGDLVPEDISSNVVKCFVTEYYTWTNKDGNYDIGGMQYIFKDKQSDFANYTLWNFYKNMDLYISQYGTENLIEVSEVTIDSAQDGGKYEVQFPMDESEVSEDTEAVKKEYDCIDVTASWTYKENTAISTGIFQNSAVFHVVNHDGRYEIAGISAA